MTPISLRQVWVITSQSEEQTPLERDKSETKLPRDWWGKRIKLVYSKRQRGSKQELQ